MNRIIMFSAFAFCFFTAASVQAQKRFTQTGVASFYAEDFHGKKTSSGEIYNMFDMTAAHRTLPFGTRVTVHDLENGQNVTVRNLTLTLTRARVGEANGAGIRGEGGDLTIDNVAFINNQIGILVGGPPQAHIAIRNRDAVLGK